MTRQDLFSSSRSDDQQQLFFMLPPEVHCHIWSYIDFKHVFTSIHLVCKEWNKWFRMESRGMLLKLNFNTMPHVESFIKVAEEDLLFDLNIGEVQIKGLEQFEIIIKEGNDVHPSSFEEDCDEVKTSCEGNDDFNDNMEYSKDVVKQQFCPLFYFSSMTKLKCSLLIADTCQRITQYCSSYALHKHPFQKLQILDLSGNRLCEPSLASFFSSQTIFPNLTHLNLSSNHFGRKFVHDLITQGSHLGRLKSLNLSNNYIGSEGVIALCECEIFSNLECSVHHPPPSPQLDDPYYHFHSLFFSICSADSLVQKSFPFRLPILCPILLKLIFCIHCSQYMFQGILYSF